MADLLNWILWGWGPNFCFITSPSISDVYEFGKVIRELLSLTAQPTTPIKGESTSEKGIAYVPHNTFQSIRVLP